MSAFPTGASTAPVSPKCPLGEGIRTRMLYRAMTSCDSFAAAAEKGLLSGSVGSVRLAFKHAEEAFEEAQHCVSELAAEEMTSEIEQKLNALGLRLDALWMRLVCVYR